MATRKVCILNYCGDFAKQSGGIAMKFYFESLRAFLTILASCGIAGVLGNHERTLAGPFQNLDFESASVGSTPPGGIVRAASALPFWSCNNYRAGYVVYDGRTLDSYAVSVHDGRGIGVSTGDFKPLDGR